MDPFYYFCFMFVFITLFCLFLAALWSPAGKAPLGSPVCNVFLCSWLLCTQCDDIV